MTLPHIRAMLRTLRRDYGITNATPGHGGKHPCIWFTHPRTGERRRLIMPGTPSDRRAAANQQTLIRQMLGSPIPVTERIKRTMETMMPEPFNSVPLQTPAPVPTKASKPTTCRVAKYAGNRGEAPRLRLNLPASLGIDKWRGVGFKIIGPDTWELWDDASSHKRWRKGDQRNYLKIDLIHSEISNDRFGSSPAEVIEVDGHLLVTCPIETRVPLDAPQRIASPTIQTDLKIEAIESPAKVAEVAEVVEVDDHLLVTYPIEAANVSQDPREAMLAVLREIARLERETDRELIKMYSEARGHWWEWHTAPIRLED